MLHLNALLKPMAGRVTSFIIWLHFSTSLCPLPASGVVTPPKLTLGHNSSYPKLDANSGIAFTRPLLNAESPDMEYSKQTNKQKTTAKKITEVPVL